MAAANNNAKTAAAGSQKKPLTNRCQGGKPLQPIALNRNTPQHHQHRPSSLLKAASCKPALSTSRVSATNKYGVCSSKPFLFGPNSISKLLNPNNSFNNAGAAATGTTANHTAATKEGSDLRLSRYRIPKLPQKDGGKQVAHPRMPGARRLSASSDDSSSDDTSVSPERHNKPSFLKKNKSGFFNVNKFNSVASRSPTPPKVSFMCIKLVFCVSKHFLLKSFQEL